MVGLVPGFGEAADVANAVWYVAEAKYLDAGLSLISVIPVVGDVIGKGGKLTKRLGGDAGKRVLDALQRVDVLRFLDQFKSHPKLGPFVARIQEAVQKWVDELKETAKDASSGRQRLTYQPTVQGVPNRPPGWGRTNKYGDVLYSTVGSATDQALARHHEMVHSFLSPKLMPLREFPADLMQWSYDKSAFLRYVEEALAETHAQLRVHGLRGLPTGIQFPIKEGYATVEQVVREGAIGTVVIGGITYGVYVVADRPGEPGR